MGKINLGEIKFNIPKRWHRVEGEHKIMILGRSGTTVPIMLEDKATVPDIVSTDKSVHSATYFDKYYSSRSNNAVTLSVKKFMDFEVGCEFIKNQAANRNAQRKEFVGQHGFLVENNPQSYDFFFAKNGRLVNINATSPNVIVFFIPEPKNKALSILGIIVGLVFIVLALLIGFEEILRFVILIIFGALVIFGSALNIRDMNEGECK